MGNIVCCSTVEDKPNESSNEQTSEQSKPVVFTYPVLSQNQTFPRSLSDTTIRVYPAN
jgi:hypothetical protein